MLRYFSHYAAASALAMIIIATPALTGDIGDKQVNSANCAACHAGGMNVIMPEKTL